MKLVTLILLAGVLCTSCLITDAAGIKPSDGVPGKEVAERVQSDIRLVYARLLTARYGFADHEMMTGIQTVTMNTAGRLGVKDGQFYTVTSFRKCIDTINSTGPILALEQLKAKETSSGISKTDIKGTGTIVGFFLLTFCSIEETGQVIQMGATSI